MRMSLITIPTNSRVRNFPVPCRKSATRRYTPAMIVKLAMIVEPTASMYTQFVMVFTAATRIGKCQAAVASDGSTVGSIGGAAPWWRV